MYFCLFSFFNASAAYIYMHFSLPANAFLSKKVCLLFMSAAYIQMHLRLLKTGQLLTERSDLGPYCLQYMDNDIVCNMGN